MFIDELVQRIDERLDELKQEIAPLEQARAALNGSPSAQSDRPASPASTAEAMPRRAPRKRRTGKRAAVRTESIESLLSASDGLSTSGLAEQTGTSQNQVRTLLKKLEQEGKVKRSGERRATRWHVVTDEDRVRRARGGARSPERSRKADCQPAHSWAA
jgi:DNA-binding transcriptional ArsR family regulator